MADPGRAVDRRKAATILDRRDRLDCRTRYEHFYRVRADLHSSARKRGVRDAQYALPARGSPSQ